MLKEILIQPHLQIDLAYATSQNFMQKKIYENARCYLHTDAYTCFMRAFDLAQAMGYGLKIFDAFRPVEAQWKLWEICPDPLYVANPERGSSHSRGIAIDLTLTNKEGIELDMGTSFDDFTVSSHHRATDIPAYAQQNRFILLGLMTVAGFDFYQNEWWHYQLHEPSRYPLLSDEEAPFPLMSRAA
ncbi:D-alanyl-D-alanine dipeptidase [Caedimonas varicaedens]|jgi:D-alanyl-D-alanine dipeptidase|uniref:D-alanyl-D-alanine dipeptidase n=1 Tax=Caedimonas varicaedens TaxID=1629334 RepID=A0A0K8MEM1_9PROT|nr:D-alanyl-D-alanine dipeptidase [Caedimonas varicaedens]